MSSIFNLFGKAEKPKRDLKQQEILKETRSALIKSCKVCNAQSAEKVVYGEDVETGLTCKRCELKAVSNDPPKLISHLVLVDKFAETLAKEIKVYNTEKQNPHNTIRTHTLQVTEGIKQAQTQIAQIKEAYKDLQAKTQQKLGQIVTLSTSCNRVPVFENVNKLVTDKKLESIGNGSVLVKDTIVKESLHFLNQSEIDEDNKKLGKRQGQAIVTCEVNLETIDELIAHIDKLLV